jgi:SAM-dependent methyltransferase
MMDFSVYLKTLQSTLSLNIHTEGAVRHADFMESSLAYEGSRPREIILESLEPILEQGDDRLGLGADHATFSTARVLIQDREKIQGQVVCEVGCGTGFLSILCYRLGARRVLATDIDERCLKYARENVKLNRADVLFFQGDLLQNIPKTESINVILSNLPQKPVSDPGTFSIAYQGGFDGTDLLRKLIFQASQRLNPGNRLYLFYHSLANPQVLQDLSQHFEVFLRAWKCRIFTCYELEKIFPHISQLKKEGKSFFDLYEERTQRYFFYGMVLEGVRR